MWLLGWPVICACGIPWHTHSLILRYVWLLIVEYPGILTRLSFDTYGYWLWNILAYSLAYPSIRMVIDRGTSWYTHLLILRYVWLLIVEYPGILTCISFDTYGYWSWNILVYSLAYPLIRMVIDCGISLHTHLHILRYVWLLIVEHPGILTCLSFDTYGYWLWNILAYSLAYPSIRMVIDRGTSWYTHLLILRYVWLLIVEYPGILTCLSINTYEYNTIKQFHVSSNSNYKCIMIFICRYASKYSTCFGY